MIVYSVNFCSTRRYNVIPFEIHVLFVCLLGNLFSSGFMYQWYNTTKYINHRVLRTIKCPYFFNFHVRSLIRLPTHKEQRQIVKLTRIQKIPEKFVKSKRSRVFPQRINGASSFIEKTKPSLLS